MSRVDRVVGISAFGAGILLALTGWRLDPGTSKLPGPGFFPLLIALTMGGLGICLFLYPGRVEKPLRTEGSHWGLLSIALLSIIAYAALLNPLGYLLSTFGFLVVQLRWVEKRGWFTAVATAAPAAGISLLLFRVLLKVPLPVGLLPLPKGW